MEVILLKEVNHLGNPGDIVKVKNGYANNYLIPQRLAVRKSDTALKILEKQKEEFRNHIAEREKIYQEITDKIDKIENAILYIRASKEGKTFGAITSIDIQDYLKTHHDLNIDRRNIIIKNPIKTLGHYDIHIVLNKNFSSVLKVDLQNIEEQSED